jgi:hypothetical protein
VSVRATIRCNGAPAFARAPRLLAAWSRLLDGPPCAGGLSRMARSR